MYAIVDIETTGGNFKNGRITEIAIYRHDGEKIVDEFVSLVNPECYIPEYITQLTGISNQMVQKAPSFPQIARRVLDMTADAVFVAHNATFDYNFIRAEFSSLGFDFVRPNLCTVKMSRKLLPGHASYSLGNLTQALGITIQGRHRAGGDAYATVQLFNILLRKNGGLFLKDDPYQEFCFDSLHSALSPDQLKSLPTLSGIFYLYNENGDVLSVGQASNLRQQVMLLLAGVKGNKNAELRRSVADFSFKLIGSKLVLGLMEILEKQALKPILDKGVKSNGNRWGIFFYQDQKGYRRLFCSALNGRTDALAIFSTAAAARKGLTEWCSRYHLCQQLCGLSEGEHGCFQYQIKLCRGACVGQESADDYNRRVGELLAAQSMGLENAVIVDRGEAGQDRGFVLVEKGAVRGYGFLSEMDSITSIEDFKSSILVVADSLPVRSYIRDYLNQHSVERILRF